MAQAAKRFLAANHDLYGLKGEAELLAAIATVERSLQVRVVNPQNPDQYIDIIRY